MNKTINICRLLQEVVKLIFWLYKLWKVVIFYEKKHELSEI